jgi:hypothetical protein
MAMKKQPACRSWLPSGFQIPCRLTGPHKECWSIQTLPDGQILEVSWKLHDSKKAKKN